MLIILLNKKCHTLVFATESNAKIPLAFCQRHQGDANFLVCLQKDVISLAHFDMQDTWGQKPSNYISSKTLRAACGYPNVQCCDRLA